MRLTPQTTITSSPGRLPATLHPVEVVLDLPQVSAYAAALESELGAHAASDPDKCCGYFPALHGVPGIHSDLPACRAFATRLPLISHGGAGYRFNFLRLSLMQQSADPAYHLDSDAATALSGDVATLGQRRVMRLLLNLSSHSARTLHYLDVDPGCVELTADGSYVRAAHSCELQTRARKAAVRARCGSRVGGLLFAANLVLHSGVDNADGHFVAAYGFETKDDSVSVDLHP
jgi:hypothetical protein